MTTADIWNCNIEGKWAGSSRGWWHHCGLSPPFTMEGDAGFQVQLCENQGCDFPPQLHSQTPGENISYLAHCAWVTSKNHRVASRTPWPASSPGSFLHTLSGSRTSNLSPNCGLLSFPASPFRLRTSPQTQPLCALIISHLKPSPLSPVNPELPGYQRCRQASL